MNKSVILAVLAAVAGVASAQVPPAQRPVAPPPPPGQPGAAAAGTACSLSGSTQTSPFNTEGAFFLSSALLNQRKMPIQGPLPRFD